MLEQDRSAAAVVDQLCDDRLADVRAGGAVLADAVRAVVRADAAPASMEQLTDALATYWWLVDEDARTEQPPAGKPCRCGHSTDEHDAEHGCIA